MLLILDMAGCSEGSVNLGAGRQRVGDSVTLALRPPYSGGREWILSSCLLCFYIFAFYLRAFLQDMPLRLLSLNLAESGRMLP